MRLSLLLFALPISAEAGLWARIDDKNIVQEVIVAEPHVVAKKPGRWIETWQDGGPRKRYAGKGYEYHQDLDGFAPKKPFPKWKLNKNTMLWEPPTPKPKDGKEYDWNDADGSWKESKKEAGNGEAGK